MSRFFVSMLTSLNPLISVPLIVILLSPFRFMFPPAVRLVLSIVPLIPLFSEAFIEAFA